MNSLQLEQNQIENAIIKVCDFIESHKREIPNWKDYSEEQLWFELVSCILGSRVRYETAKDCVTHLRNIGLLDISNLLKNPMRIEKIIIKELRRPIYTPFSKGIGSKYRYPKSKSRFIINTCVGIYGNNQTIRNILKKSHDGYEARDILIQKCWGIGPKQASLFLRNIEYSEDLAILDCHVMNYMKMQNIDKEFDISNLKGVCSYYEEENKLRMYALSKRKNLATLDIGIWTVMRIIKGSRI